MRNQLKQEVMFAKVDAWEESGKTIVEFASELGISKHALSYWINKKRKTNKKPPVFMELAPEVVRNVAFTKVSSAGQAKMEITFPSGMCVKIYG